MTLKAKRSSCLEKKNESKQLVQIAEKKKKKKRLTDTITHTYYTWYTDRYYNSYLLYMIHK